MIPAEGRLSEDAGGGENQRVRPPSDGFGQNGGTSGGFGAFLEMKTVGDGVSHEVISSGVTILRRSDDLDCAQGA